MLQVTPQMRIFVATEVVDFRKGLDGLIGYCKSYLQKDPFSGAMFCFTNRAKISIKILVYDGQGFWLCQKRLSTGRLRWWPAPGQAGRRQVELAARNLQILLWNGDPELGNMQDDWRKLKPLEENSE